MDTTLLPGRVRLVQHRLPGFQAGDYELMVDQTLTAPGGGETFRSRARFAVTGERFRLDPADIDSTFPPPNAAGEFLNILPHLVLNRSTLPWIRSPRADGSRGGDGTPDFPLADDVPTWLALLVFDATETVPAVRAGTVADLRAPQQGLISYPLADDDRATSGDSAAGPYAYAQADSDPCQVMDLDYAQFLRIAPALEDLLVSAAVRQVSGQKADADPDAPPGGEYAVLMSNRLPRAGSRTTVHLVSLEGMDAYLPGGASSLSTDIVQIRLASLYRWSFDSVAEPETFADVLSRLAPWRSIGYAAPPTDRDVAPDVLAAVASGYIALEHHMRNGRDAYSWYRGALTPFPVPRSTIAQYPISAADAALRLDPSTGLFDVSYAAAWQLGRFMALSDQTFANRLFDWKHASTRQAVHDAELSALAARLGVETPLPTAAAVATSALDSAKASVAALLGVERSPPPPAAPADAPPTGSPLEAIDDWLQRLRHLHGIPFRYLVPDPSMLPLEAIRFFHLDPNWIDALVDGAWSLGAIDEGDLTGDAQPAPARSAAGSGSEITGFLLRSRAVEHWPGLEVEARDASGAPLALLRFERLSPQTLLVLIDGVVAGLDLHEPPEALHYGFDVSEAASDSRIGPDRLYKKLRDPVTGASHGAGETGPTLTALTWRDGHDALALATMARKAATALAAPRFTSAEWHLVMIEGADRVTFGQPGQEPTS